MVDEKEHLEETGDSGKPSKKRSRLEEDTAAADQGKCTETEDSLGPKTDMPVQSSASSLCSSAVPNLGEEDGSDVLSTLGFLPSNYTKEELLQVLRDRKALGPRPSKPDEVTFEQLGGMKETVKKLLPKIQLPFFVPQFFEQFHIKPSSGAIFYGPPGTGKTSMGKAILNWCNTNPVRRIPFYAPPLYKFCVKTGALKFSDLYSEARKLGNAVVFLDYLDLLLSPEVRSGKDFAVLSDLLDALDSSVGRVVTIAAAFDIEKVHQAIRRRLDVELPFPLPDMQARKEILTIAMGKWDGVTDTMLQFITERSIGYSGADLYSLARTALEAGLKRMNPHLFQWNVMGSSQPIKPVQLNIQDVEKAFTLVKPLAERLM